MGLKFNIQNLEIWRISDKSYFLSDYEETTALDLVYKPFLLLDLCHRILNLCRLPPPPLSVLFSFCVVKILYILLIVILLIANPLSTLAADAANTITITNKSGSIRTNYPLQFGRPF